VASSSIQDLHPRQDVAALPAVSEKRRRGRPRKTPAQADGASSPSQPAIEPLAVRIDTAARLLGCGISSIKELVASGTLPSVKIGSMRLINFRALKKLAGEE
jgi:excisionase family DNA binding protein